jgi:hypothetical protein
VNGYRMTCAAALMTVVLAGAAAVPGFAADSPDASADLLKRGSQMMSVRAGYAKATGDVTTNGLVGAGFGYRRFVLDRWSVGAFAHYELLGRSGSASKIEIPLTLEVTRHTRWGAAAFPYVGIGGGAFYHKRYRTGADVSGFGPGRYLVCGMQVPVRKQGLLGLDVRMITVDRLDADPAFPGPPSDRHKIDDLLVDLKVPSNPDMPLLFADSEAKTRTLWSIKLDYSISY